MPQYQNWALDQQQRLLCEEKRQREAHRMERERIMLGSMKRDETIEARRRIREMQQEMQDRSMERDILQAEEERIAKEKQMEHQERMAEELARINHEKQREEKTRQHIKENSMEIRELESKLLLAYVSKERAAQITEQEARKVEARRQETDSSTKIGKENERTAVEKQKRDQKRHEELLKYQKDLRQQLKDREGKRQEAYEEFLKEKLMVDEIIRKIYEEDQIERQQKLEKVKATQEQIEHYKQQRVQWQCMEREKVEAENRRIVEFANYQQIVEEARMAKLREREAAKQLLYKQLSEKMEEENQQREAMDSLREQFYLEEQEEAARQKEIQEMEEKIRVRLMMQQTCQEQLASKEMKRKKEKEELEAFRKTMMAKFAEDDRIELMNTQKRRMKQLQHKHEVEKLIEDRRQQREAKWELELKERAMEKQREELRRQIIEEERLHLLKRHAVKLLGHLPKGLLREDDLEHFDEDFRKNFQPTEKTDE